MKRILCMMLILLLSTLCFAGCGEDKKPQSKTNTKPQNVNSLPEDSLFSFYDTAEMDDFVKNFYTDTPVSLECLRANISDEVTEDPELIKETFEELKKVRIGDKATISITDSEIYYTFTMSDGRQINICFESEGLFMCGGTSYNVVESGDLFNIKYSEDEY